MTPLSVSQIAEIASKQWPVPKYWEDNKSKVVTASIGNRFVIHERKNKRFLVIEFRDDKLKHIKTFTNKHVARNYIHGLWRDEKNEDNEN